MQKKPATKKSTKAPTAKSRPAPHTEASENIKSLLKAKIIAKDVQLSPAEVQALDGLTKAEVDAVISIKTKLSSRFFKKQAAHGKYY